VQLEETRWVRIPLSNCRPVCKRSAKVADRSASGLQKLQTGLQAVCKSCRPVCKVAVSLVVVTGREGGGRTPRSQHPLPRPTTGPSEPTIPSEAFSTFVRQTTSLLSKLAGGLDRFKHAPHGRKLEEAALALGQRKVPRLGIHCDRVSTKYVQSPALRPVRSSRLIGRTESSEAVDGEWPRKGGGRRVHDLLSLHWISQGSAIKDECLLHEEDLQRLRFGGKAARDLRQLPILQDVPPG